MVSEAAEQKQIVLATLPPSQRQIRLALGIVVALLVALILTTPFANTQLPRVDAFTPALDTAIAINDIITSALMFAQFFIVDRRAIFVLATGYLYTGLMAIAHMLTFPGAFAPTGLLGAGLQSTAWLYGSHVPARAGSHHRLEYRGRDRDSVRTDLDRHHGGSASAKSPS